MTQSRRDYAWNVDTLNTLGPGGSIYDIWGSSPSDVWAVSGMGVHTLWHYNGTVWSPWINMDGHSLYSIFGTSTDNIWMGGNDGRIYHFDGNQWSLSFNYRPEGMYNALINTIWGSSDSNLYATGTLSYPGERFNGFLLHFNGKSWVELAVTQSSIQLAGVRGDSNGIFVAGIDIHSLPNKVYLYRYENSNLTELFSASTKDAYVTFINKIGSDVYFVIGEKVFTFLNNQFIEQLNFEGQDFGHWIGGRHRNDLFYRTGNSMKHFNGIDQQPLIVLESQNMRFSHNALLFENDIFLIVNDRATRNNFIYRGTLSN